MVYLSSRLALAAFFLAPAALAGPPPKASSHAAAPGHSRPARLRTASFEGSHRPTPGRSLGSPTDGHLIGGAHLTEAPHLRIVPVYAGGDARWGLEPLVQMIDHAARVVRKQYPEAVLSVGHLSKPGGGGIDRHASHESGRDADVGFYVKNQQGKSIYADHFVPFKGDGTAISWPGAQFDDARNWAFVASVASEVHARVTHIFVATPLRARLLAYAEKMGAPPAIRTRAAELMAQPKGSLPHDDHFHVRIGCPAGMEKCVEIPMPRKHLHGSLAHAHGTHETHPHAPAHGAPGHGAAAPSKPAAAPAAPRRAPAPADDGPSSNEEESAKSEASVPSLSPVVPGLDSAVIAAPLGGQSAPAPSADPPPPASDVAPIDDPDGVLN